MIATWLLPRQCGFKRYRTGGCHGPDSRSCSYHQVVSRCWSLPTTSWKPVQVGSAEGSTTPAWIAWGSAWTAPDCSNFPKASATAGTPQKPWLWLPYHFLYSAWLSKWALISFYCCPFLSEWVIDTRRQLTDRSSAKTKAEPQGLCALGRRDFAPETTGKLVS